MSLFARLFKPKPPPVPIKHPHFGELLGFRAPNGSVRSWEARDPLNTPLGPLKIEFSAGADGPTHEQFQLLQEVAGNLIQLRNKANPFLEGWLEHRDPNLAPENIEPVKILIWDEPMEWSLEFYLASHFWRFLVTFKGEEPEHSDFDSDS